MTRILIVEDESIVALDMQTRLQRLGYDVPAVASTGAGAIEEERMSFLQKPFIPDALVLKVRKVLDTRAPDLPHRFKTL